MSSESRDLETRLLGWYDSESMTSLDTAIRGRLPIIMISTHEESRVLRRICELFFYRRIKVSIWTYADGLMDYDVEAGTFAKSSLKDADKLTDPIKFIEFVESDNDIRPPGTDGEGGGAVYIMLDSMHQFPASRMGTPLGPNEAKLVRRIKTAAPKIQNKRQHLIFLSRDLVVPDDLEEMVHVIDWPLPTFEIVKTRIKMLIEACRGISNEYNKQRTPSCVDFSEEHVGRLAKALQGLTIQQIDSVFRMCMTHGRQFGIEDYIGLANEAKREIIRKTGSGLEYVDVSNWNMSSLGGLEALKEYLVKRRYAFTEKGMKYLGKNPKGIMLIGMQGCGKSGMAKAVAGEWNLPLFKLDFGSVYKGLVGGSESTLRAVLKAITAVSPCILWVDELEKGAAGSESSGFTDGGTSARVLGYFLTWLEEKEAPVYVIFTANDISKLPPELMRKGRVDEIFAVSFPNAAAREQIFRIHIKKSGFDPDSYNMSRLVSITPNFSGSEIEEAIAEAMYIALHDSIERDIDPPRAISNSDIEQAILKTKPLFKTAGEKMQRLKHEIETRARWAAEPEDLESAAAFINEGDNLDVLSEVQYDNTPDLG